MPTDPCFKVRQSASPTNKILFSKINVGTVHTIGRNKKLLFNLREQTYLCDENFPTRWREKPYSETWLPTNCYKMV
jgi:hypothetical protein